MSNRSIPRIDFSNFENRTDEISEQMIQAAKNDGFFIIHNQTSPNVEQIGEIFKRSKEFFQSDEMTVKNSVPFIKLKNTGYEKLTQIRPSTMSIDQKESLQLQYHRKNDYWPKGMPQDWYNDITGFIEDVQGLSKLILSIFENYLNLPKGYLSDRSHDISAKTAQSTLRLLHYYPIDDTNSWRAGPHTDFDCLTLLFQETNSNPQGDGLEICPGRETFTEFGHGDEWTSVPAQLGDIVVNIGDMLMSWSDDEFKSTFHRVRPIKETMSKDRYSFAWFNQANKDVVIQGAKKKYPKTTGQQFIEDAMKRNYQMLKENTTKSASASS